jgi:O-antigen/teichoic acid export membrane protein
VVGGVASRGLILVASIALARIMGKEPFGELGIIQITVGMFGTLAGFGLGVTATKHVAELREKDPSRAARILALSTRFSVLASGTAAIMLAAAAPWLAGHSLAAPQLAEPLRISALLLFLSGVSGAQLGALAGFQAFPAIALVNVGQAGVTAPLMVLGAWQWGLDGVVWAMSLGMLASCLLGHRAVLAASSTAGVTADASGWHREGAVLWRFSLPAAMAGAMVGPVNWACSAILVNQIGGYAEMGVFNAANQWFAGLMFLPGLAGQVVLPMMAEQMGVGEQGRSVRLMRRVMRLNVLLFLPVLLLCAVSPAIMSLYGAGFEGRWMPLAVAVLTAGVVAVQAPVGQLVTASGRVWAGLAMNLGWAAVFLAATLLLARPWGADGLAVARLLAYLVHAVWTFGFAAWMARSQGQ